MNVFIDSYAGSAGSNVLAHQSDSGASYAAAPGNTAGFALDGAGRIYNTGSGTSSNAVLKASTTLDQIKYPATLNFDLKLSSVVNGAAGYTVFQQPGTTAHVWLRYYNNASGFDAIQLLQFDSSGGNSLLGQVASPGLSIGTTYRFSLVLNSPTSYGVSAGPVGATPTHYFDATTSAPLTGGNLGPRMDVGGSASTGYQIGPVSLVDATIAPPTLGTITVTSANGIDTITYPAPMGGVNPIGGVVIFAGTSPGGEGTTPVRTIPGTGGGTATYTAGGLYYTAQAYDNASPASYSAISNEVQGGAASTGGATAAQVQSIVSAQLSMFLSTYFPPLFLGQLQNAVNRINATDLTTLATQASLATVAADVATLKTGVNITSLGGSAGNLTLLVTALGTSATATANQLALAYLNATLPGGTQTTAQALAGVQADVATLKTGVNLTAITGNTNAATQLVTQLSTSASTLVNQIGDAAASAVWASTNRTMTAFGFNVSLAAGGLDAVMVENGVNLPKAIGAIHADAVGVVTGDGAETGSGSFTVMVGSTVRMTGTMLKDTRTVVSVNYFGSTTAVTTTAEAIAP